MKKFAVLLMILCMVSISRAEMLADFEDGLDGFEAINSPAVTLTNPTEPAGAITSGSHCLKIVTAGSNYWPLRWTPATIPTKLGKLSFDTTMFATDWPTNPWTKFPDKLTVQINGGWSEILLDATNWKWRDPANTNPCPADWGAWDGDCAKTCTVDLSSYSMEGATSFAMVISINSGTAGIFYLDNFHFVDQPSNPSPANGGIAVIGSDTTLSWENSTDSLSQVNVWFGTPPEPNEADPNTILSGDTYKTLLTKIYTEDNPGAISSCAMPAITDGVTYTWCVDGEPNNFPVLFWTFTATTNNPPVATAGADQYIYDYTDLNNIVITLNGSASDDGLLLPLTYAWTKTAGPAAVINNPNAAVTTVTLTGGLANNTEDGSAAPYVFQLVADDGYFTDSDDVTVYVNSDSCRATIEAGGFYFYGDIASAAGAGLRDCKIDLYDFAELAVNWLRCSDTFEPCN